MRKDTRIQERLRTVIIIVIAAGILMAVFWSRMIPHMRLVTLAIGIGVAGAAVVFALDDAEHADEPAGAQEPAGEEPMEPEEARREQARDES